MMEMPDKILINDHHLITETGDREWLAGDEWQDDAVQTEYIRKDIYDVMLYNAVKIDDRLLKQNMIMREVLGELVNSYSDGFEHCRNKAIQALEKTKGIEDE